jgi:glycerate 2-kinase
VRIVVPQSTQSSAAPSASSTHRELLLASFQAAVDAADPLKILANAMPSAKQLQAYGRIVVVGAGKAGGSMAAAVEAYWLTHALDLDKLQGLVITRYGHGAATQCIEIIEAGHPVPDQAGELAAHRILEMATSLTEKDLLIVLVSGGGSSLLSLPVASVPMVDLKASFANSGWAIGASDKGPSIEPAYFRRTGGR